MKRPAKILKSLSFLIVTAVTAACNGDGPGGNKPSEPEEPYTLSVDKTSIESDGQDKATFTITDANGMLLTDAEYIKKTSFHIEETDQWQSGMTDSEANCFSTISDGTYTVSALFEGKECANKVTVTSSNRSHYERFRKNVAIYRLTGTWCQYCPSMTEALANVNSFTKEHSLVLEFHNSDEFSVPYNSSTDLASVLLSTFGSSNDGLPFCIYSLAEGSGSRKISEIQGLVKEQLYENPARTGIAATSKLSGNTLTINAKVAASQTGKYDLGLAVLKDNCKPASSSASESVYNDVVVSISGNFFAMSGETSFTLKEGQEQEIVKQWTSEALSTGIRDYRIVLFTLREAAGKTLIDNIVDFKAGESIDYIYN